MRKLILIFLCLPLLFSCGGPIILIPTPNTSVHQQKNDLIEQFTSDLKQTIEASNNRNWDVVISMTYPKLFDGISKEEFKVVFASMFETFKDLQTLIHSNVRHSYPVIDYEGDQFTKFSYDSEMIFTFYNTDDLDNILPGLVQQFGEDNMKIFRNTKSVNINIEASMLAVLEANTSEWKYLNWEDNMDQFIPASVFDHLK